MPPTYEKSDRFKKDLSNLDDSDLARFQAAVTQFIEDLEAGNFRPGLRVRGVVGAKGVFEMSWAPDGRATWQYGDEILEGEPHVVWRRVGTHDIFRRP